ncbi:MAG: tRNA (adenosine(37)-N6)-threonylcarbamoyltransferase complex ATPase subunit type 1 TsaE [Methylococcus sp.]
MTEISIELPDEASTLRLARAIMSRLAPGGLIFLRGSLGAGKTCFVRGCLRQAGYQGAVKSPTFTLVEPYSLPGGRVYHFDLYRLNDPEELEWMGIRDYLESEAICFMEWPERGEGCLPRPDLDIDLQYAGSGRRATLRGVSPRGVELLAALDLSGEFRSGGVEPDARAERDQRGAQAVVQASDP